MLRAEAACSFDWMAGQSADVIGIWGAKIASQLLQKRGTHKRFTEGLPHAAVWVALSIWFAWINAWV